MTYHILRFFNIFIKWPLLWILQIISYFKHYNWYTEFPDIPIILSGLPTAEYLKKNKDKISLIINMCDEFLYDSCGIPTVHYNVIDGTEPNINIYMHASITIQNEILINNNKKILIHCKGGQYRSASILLAWMYYHYSVKRQFMSLTKCLQYIKMYRPQVGNNIATRKNIIVYTNIINNLFY